MVICAYVLMRTDIPVCVSLPLAHTHGHTHVHAHACTHICTHALTYTQKWLHKTKTTANPSEQVGTDAPEDQPRQKLVIPEVNREEREYAPREWCEVLTCTF